MFRKVLIANRGEIAVRIIRALREMNIRSVAVFSDADRTALHVRMADEAEHIGSAPSSESYLRIDRIIDAAKNKAAWQVVLKFYASSRWRLGRLQLCRRRSAFCPFPCQLERGCRVFSD